MGPMADVLPRLTWRVMDPDEPLGEPVPICCQTCQDTGIVPGESVFVNTAHSYGREYLGAPCPDCDGWED